MNLNLANSNKLHIAGLPWNRSNCHQIHHPLAQVIVRIKHRLDLRMGPRVSEGATRTKARSDTPMVILQLHQCLYVVKIWRPLGLLRSNRRQETIPVHTFQSMRHQGGHESENDRESKKRNWRDRRSTRTRRKHQRLGFHHRRKKSFLAQRVTYLTAGGRMSDVLGIFSSVSKANSSQHRSSSTRKSSQHSFNLPVNGQLENLLESLLRASGQHQAPP